VVIENWLVDTRFWSRVIYFGHGYPVQISMCVLCSHL